MKMKHREHLNKILSYPEDSAGRIMNKDFLFIDSKDDRKKAFKIMITLVVLYLIKIKN